MTCSLFLMKSTLTFKNGPTEDHGDPKTFNILFGQAQSSLCVLLSPAALGGLKSIECQAVTASHVKYLLETRLFIRFDIDFN